MADYSKGFDNIGISLTLKGRIFKIIEVIDATIDIDRGPFVILPFDEIRKIGGKINKFNIITIRILSEKQLNKLKTEISNIDKNAFVDRTPEYEKEVMNKLSSDYFRRIILFLLLNLIAVLNCLLLLQFWLNNKAKEMTCYKIAGAANYRIFMILFCEMMSLVLFSEVLSVIVFEMLARRIFRIIGIDIVLAINEYLLTFCAITITAAAVVSAMIYCFTKIIGVRGGASA